MPRLYRALVRDGTVAAGCTAAWGLAVHPAATVAILGAIIFASGAWMSWWLYCKLRHFRHHWRYVRPLRRKLTRQLQGAPPRLAIEPDRSKVTIGLPPELTFTPRDWELLELAVTATTGLESPERHPELQGPRPYVIYSRSEPPPANVTLAAVRGAAIDAAEHEIIMGLGKKDQVTAISIDNDSPHVGLSMGSGDGKSVTARNAAAQLAHHGALIVVLDTKYISQHWCAGLPNVAIAREAAEIHDLALWLYEEVSRRKKLAFYHADVEGVVHANPGPRIVGILEELNATQSELTEEWKARGGKGRSPAVVALDKVAFIGRQVGVNLLYIGQRLSAKAVSGGSGDARENLGVLLMSNPTASTWKMLVGDRHALPAATEARGRLQIVTAKTVTEVQGAYLTGKQAREYAVSGAVAAAPAGMPCVGGLAPVGTPERLVQDVPDMPALPGHGPDLHVVRDSPRQPPLSPRITIREAIAEGISGPTYEAVRRDLNRRRNKGQPVPAVVGARGNADEYDRIEWCDWEEARRQPRRLVR